MDAILEQAYGFAKHDMLEALRVKEWAARKERVLLRLIGEYEESARSALATVSSHGPGRAKVCSQTWRISCYRSAVARSTSFTRF
jgi:hypothetical protein